LIPLAWHNEIGGFDESMFSWEDVDYHWRMARHGKCYTRVTAPLMVYRFYTGTRRQMGLDSHPELLDYITKKYQKEKIMACGCKKGNNVPATSPAMVAGQPTNRSNSNMSEDFNYKKIIYLHANTGEHSVIGASTRTNYGYRKHGDIFIVHVTDIAAQPDLFGVIPTEPEAAVPAVQRETKPPQVIVVEHEAKPAEVAEQPKTPAPEELSKIDNEDPPVDAFKTLPGKTYLKAARLSKAGVNSLDDILRVGVEGLLAIEGIGKTNAQNWYDIAWVTLEGQKADG
jgi:hypothetical protein